MMNRIYMRRINDSSLYLVISEEYGKHRSALDIAGAAIRGGVDIIQLREKKMMRDELISIGNKLSRLCRENKVIFIINDDPLLAKEVNADGVHLGQEDALKYPIKETRKILGNDKIIGISTHSIDQFIQASQKDYDYIAFGPIFPTKTKDYFLGTADIKEVIGISRRPVFFIGGINLSNMDEILKEGARNIALIRGITEAEDITLRTRGFKNKLDNSKVEVKAGV